MQLVLATNNENKIIEIKHLLEDLPITILTCDDFLEFPDVEETGTTLEENAILKAKAIYEFTDLPSLADDTGLEVDALNGAPGIFSARYAGENVSYEDNNRKLIADLIDIPDNQRTARFRTVIAICLESEITITVEGSAEGVICTEIKGSQGFGYDPIFYFPPMNKRFSEMTLDEKNLISHRGKALTLARDEIIRWINKSD